MFVDGVVKCVGGWVCKGKQRWNGDVRFLWSLLEVRR
jgi:hypothetical protein